MSFVARMKPFLVAGCAAVAYAGAPSAWAAPVAVASTADGALLPVQVDAAKGKVLFTLPAPAADGTSGRYLFTQAIKTGLGSAAIRIDRGMQGDTKVLAFRRMGGKVAVVFENPRFRASGDAGVQMGAKASFPFSTVAMLDVVSEGANMNGGSVTVDLTPLLMTDAMDLVARSARAQRATSCPKSSARSIPPL
ncbi:hypothetical protein ACFSLT_26570 [Novosphingobium resinovorum]